MQRLTRLHIQPNPTPIPNSTAVQEQLAAARDGLLDILPLSTIQALSPSELRAAICGAGHETDPLALHPDRWAEHTELEGYQPDSPQVRSSVVLRYIRWLGLWLTLSYHNHITDPVAVGVPGRCLAGDAHPTPALHHRLLAPARAGAFWLGSGLI